MDLSMQVISKFCVWWQYHVFLNITALKSPVWCWWWWCEGACVCDIICCLPVDQEWLQGCMSQTYARTLITLHVCWVKKCPRMLQVIEGWCKDKCSLRWSCCQWVSARMNGWKETDQTPCNAAPTAMTDERHVQWVKSVFERMRSILCTSAALKKLRQCIPWLHFNGWWVMGAFIWPSAETTTAEWHLPMSPRRKFHGTIGVLWKSCMSCFAAAMDLCVTMPCLYFCWLRPAVRRKQPEQLEHGAIFTRTVQHVIAIVMCKIWCSVGCGRCCWYILATL
jgi:hypothetical protein